MVSEVSCAAPKCSGPAYPTVLWKHKLSVSPEGGRISVEALKNFMLDLYVNKYLFYHASALLYYMPVQRHDIGPLVNISLFKGNVLDSGRRLHCFLTPASECTQTGTWGHPMSIQVPNSPSGSLLMSS